jgi:hypothetical protein
MAKLILAEQDFAQGLKLSNLQVPPMNAVVTWENPEALKDYDKKGEKLILQNLIATAYKELTAARKEVQDAIKAFDEQLGKKPAASPEEAKERIKTFQTVCGQITKAQESKVKAAVEQVWATHKKRDAALFRINLKFAAEITLNAISLAVSITVAALSMGSLAVTLIGAAKTALSTALLIKDFASGRDSTAQEVIGIDLDLAKAYLGPNMKGKAFLGAKEVAVAAGFPFLSSVGKMETKLEDFLGKSGRVDKETQTLYEQANKLMAEIRKASEGKVGTDNAKHLKEMGDKTTSLLDQIGALNKSVDGDNLFYNSYCARCEVYKALKGRALGAAGRFAAIAVVIAGIAATAKSVADIAVKLA